MAKSISTVLIAVGLYAGVFVAFFVVGNICSWLFERMGKPLLDRLGVEMPEPKQKVKLVGRRVIKDSKKTK